jgi:hypothetical protein
MDRAAVGRVVGYEAVDPKAAVTFAETLARTIK